MLNPKLDRVKNQPLDSFNILERIQLKIEEKMTRADTSNGLIGSVAMKHFDADNNKKSSATIGVPRRCPNLQRLIEKKKQEDEMAGHGRDIRTKDIRVPTGGTILQKIEGSRNDAQMRSKTG